MIRLVRVMFAHRGPEHSSVEVGGLLDVDLQTREDVSLPRLGANNRRVKTPSHDGFGQLCIRRRKRMENQTLE